MASYTDCSLASKGSDTICDYTCLACHDLEAQFHCKECCKGFCDNCVKLHNQLYKTHSVFGREQMEKWPIAKSTLDILEQCTEHKDEKIKLFCEVHKQLCCHICVALHHRSCSKVSLIDETIKYSTADVHQLSSNIQKILEDLKERKDRAECNLKSLEKAYERIKEEIDTVRQKINAELDRLEKVTMQEVDKWIASSKLSLTKEKGECSSLQESLKCLGKAANEVCNKSSKLLFIAFEQCQQQIKNSELLLKALKNENTNDMHFAPNNDIEKSLSKLTGLGRIVHPNTVISLQKSQNIALKYHLTNYHALFMPSVSFLLGRHLYWIITITK